MSPYLNFIVPLEAVDVVVFFLQEEENRVLTHPRPPSPLPKQGHLLLVAPGTHTEEDQHGAWACLFYKLEVDFLIL